MHHAKTLHLKIANNLNINPLYFQYKLRVLREFMKNF